MAGPSYEYVPILGATGATLRVVSIDGISTKHGDTKTDRGRLYAKVTKPGSYQLDVYSRFTRQAGELVMTGTVATLATYFDLAAANTSGMTGQAIVDSYSADDSGIVLLPTFAVDHDVLIGTTDIAAMPGYDATYGLGYFHAQAMRQILAADLPRATPHLFGGVGLAAFVPTAVAASMPLLSTIANADQLRVAQASLVKALSAEQAEHLVEWRDIAAAARSRYEGAINNLAEANLKDEDEGDETDANVSSLSKSTYVRG